jgi:hypothetical protein
MPVTGYFSYSLNLLAPPDGLGNRAVSINDPSAYIYIQSSAGESAGAGNPFLSGYTVNASGYPDGGTGMGLPDLEIQPAFLRALYGPGDYWDTSVTYTITGVPDAVATWLLLGIGLASVMTARRLFPQVRL